MSILTDRRRYFQAQQAALLNLLVELGFWSKDPETDYYASLEDGAAYYSLTENE